MDPRRAPRTATVTRETNETRIEVRVDLDGTGRSESVTGIGFFDHMIDQLARHALIDITLSCDGDRHIDDHHSVEDCGIALGQALREALGEKRGIRRYGSFHLAMDDTLVRAALDLSGRPYLVWNLPFPADKIGTFDTELVREFFQAFSTHAGMTLHVDLLHGLNAHHIAEAAFKALARALREAVEPDPRLGDALPSTKGAL
ncbi:imidazoleglycerol-phosphate dehydratase HisB [Paracoccus panacisoli]|uniref:Imidazoleglycerol-phosphate dehydratase n=1 Tax=Paracoccus panacisoli TaxID=1510163 RepID=A0ABV6T6Z9_9RHOB